MEPNNKRSSNASGYINAHSPQMLTNSAVLATYLKGEMVDEESARLLARSCASPFTLVALQAASPQTETDTRDIDDILRSATFPYVMSANGNIVCVLASHADGQRLLELLRDQNQPTRFALAISLPFYLIDAIPQQYGLVKFSLSHNGADSVHNAENYALPYLKSLIKDNLDVEKLLHPALGILAHYDEVNQSNLLNTLKVYLDNDRNAQRSANILYLHRNSLQYRIRRIQEIAGIDLDDAEERSYLRLSFLLNS